ncbi:High affinity sulfate transporter 2-like protein [Drosera capensis]
MSKRISDEVERDHGIISGEEMLPVVKHGHGHKVGREKKESVFAEFGYMFKEMFFADDPLRSYKDQPASRRVLLGIEALFPIVNWIRDYNLSKFKGDLIAGLTIASLAIPQDLGYAKLAHLPPQNGLYSSFVPPLIYAFMGSSRDLAIGPVAVVSLLLGTLLEKEYDPTKQAEDYLRLAFTATFFAGITQAALGLLRLGFLIDFLSHAATVGFMAGAAITIMLQQLKGFLGIKNFTTKTDIVHVLHSAFSNAHHGWNWQTIVIASSFLAFLLVCKFIAKKNKKLFWVAAIAPLISVIISTLFVYLFHADKHGVAIVKTIKKGVNPSSVNKLFLSGPNLAKGAKIGVVAGLIGLTEAVAIGRAFAAAKDYAIDGNKEMVALGTMNIIGSLTSCYVATGSFSRTSVNFMAGCETTVSNIVMSLIVLLTLEVITPLFKYIPNAILASIIISAVSGLVDIQAMILIWKIDKFDFIACMGAFLGVVFDSVEIGLLIAVCISFAKILLQVTRPRTALLGNLPGTTIYRNVQQYPDATMLPGILIIRVDSSIYFSNSNYIRERLLRWLTDEDDKNKKQNQPRIQYLIIDLSPVIDIDTSGLNAFEDLYKSLQKRDVQVALANPGPAVIEKFHSSKFAEMIGQGRFFLTVADAVHAFASKVEEEPYYLAP